MKKLSFGIDIGGINTVIGIVDQQGDIYAERTISTCQYSAFDDYPRYIEALASAMNDALSSLDFDYELVGIGVGAPNANFLRGTIEQPANLWKYSPEQEKSLLDSERVFNFSRDIKEHFPQVKYSLLTNDANAATIGEMIFGNARGMSNFILVTLGTGLGSGFVANGELIYGHDGFAGELGHVVVERRGRLCGCGRRGCLETYASATGMCRTAFELMSDSSQESTLRDVPYNELNSYKIFQAAEAGDLLAQEVFRLTAEYLGRALADVVLITSPEAIILFGGPTKAGDMLFKPTKQYMEENLMSTFRNKVDILPSGITGKSAAILGSAALVWQKMC